MQISNDGEKFEVPFAVAQMSIFVKNTLPDDAEDITDDDREVTCPKVSGPILKKVVDFCTKYQEEKMQDFQPPLTGKTFEEIIQPKWYADFCDVDQEHLFGLVSAANFMNIKPLLDLACLAVSQKVIKGKSSDELREIFHIPSEPPAAEA